MDSNPSKAIYDELVELAKSCAYQAKVTKTKAVADEFRKMAKEYQRRAAALDGGKTPDIGEDRSG